MQFEIKGLKELRDALDPKRYKKVVTRVLNKLGSQSKTAVSREVRNTYNIKKDRLDAGFYMRRAVWENLAVILRYSGRTPGLQRFDAHTTNRGVTVKVLKTGGRKVVKGAFMPGKIIGIYKRVGKGRFPIKRLYGPDIPGMVNIVGTDAAQRVMDENADKLLDHELEYELGKK
ncbi:MAG: hypothetical protein HZB85_01765 [Deltaproteobacteria bacterium]|nr:hypothetical protein [Deltaproteobacteria bacterium]